MGSGSRHEFLQPVANTALEPGPGPITERQPFPQYGGPFPFDYNEGSGNYNALQIKLKQEVSSGLYFLTSYTWAKSIDVASDPQADSISNFYNLHADRGPSDYSRKNMFTFASSYQVPVGRGKTFLSSANSIAQTVLGNWRASAVSSLPIPGSPSALWLAAMWPT